MKSFLKFMAEFWQAITSLFEVSPEDRQASYSRQRDQYRAANPPLPYEKFERVE